MKNSYFTYLQTRSIFGFLYRKLFLYPKLHSYLKGRTLDIGCGVGDFLYIYKDIVGVDINIDCVNYCKSKGLNVQLMNIDVLPFEDNSFDSIILDNVIEHIENPSILLSEIKRVLTPKGILLIGVPCDKGYKFDIDHKIFYDIKSLQTLLSIDFILKYHFYTPPFFYLFRKLFRQVALYAIFKLK
jgi:SAM-dependent methyltransferase